MFDASLDVREVEVLFFQIHHLAIVNKHFLGGVAQFRDATHVTRILVPNTVRDGTG